MESIIKTKEQPAIDEFSEFINDLSEKEKMVLILQGIRIGQKLRPTGT